MSKIFQMQLTVGTMLDRFMALPDLSPADKARVSTYVGRLVDESSQLELCDESVNAAQLKIDAWYQGYEEAKAQAIFARKTISVAICLEYRRSGRRNLTRRQEEREAAARKASYAEFFGLVAARKAAQEALAAQYSLVETLLSEAGMVLAQVSVSAAAFAETQARTEQLRQARLAREAAMADAPAKKYAHGHVEEVMSAVRKAERSLKVTP